MGRYAIKEVFDTLQGEGERSGARSVFVRFSGCNLWSGMPHLREEGAGPCALWCDTDFLKGKIMTEEEIVAECDKLWPRPEVGERWVVLTGGEPGLQLDKVLCDALHDAGWQIAIESNGTVPNAAFAQAEWLAISPKRGTKLSLLARVAEIKVVLPGAAELAKGWTDAELEELASTHPWAKKFIQPQDMLLYQEPGLTALRGAEEEQDSEQAQIAAMRFEHALRRSIEFVRSHPEWRLSLQTNKLIGLP